MSSLSKIWGVLALIVSSSLSSFVNAHIQKLMIQQSADEATCHNACTALVDELSELVQYGPSADLQLFSVKSYYSAILREIIPACTVSPATAQDVSQAVRILQEHACPFAIKSGGHGFAVGLATAAGGIVIDLKALNQVEYLGDKDWDGVPASEREGDWSGRITRVGPGRRWGEVVDVLQQYGMAVVGGRMSLVGVGGFLLGGGISFLSQKRGWAADNVRNFEIVLPNGTITNVNLVSNPELYSALRGGGSNFGVVTRFDLETYPQGPVWGGYKIWAPPPSETREIRSKLGFYTTSALRLKQLTNIQSLGHSIGSGLLRLASVINRTLRVDDFNKAIAAVFLSQDVDLDSSVFAFYSHVSQIDSLIFGAHMVHTEGNSSAEIFKPFRDINRPLYDSSRVATLKDMLVEVEKFDRDGIRLKSYVQTIRLKPRSGSFKVPFHELLGQMYNAFVGAVDKLKHIHGMVPNLIFVPIYQNEIKGFHRNGGNAIGLRESDGPLLIILVQFNYFSATSHVKRDDALVDEVKSSLAMQVKSLAVEAGLNHPFHYMNYAGGDEDVFAGYAEGKVEWLRKVKEGVVGNGRWDVGGFKV